jgi:hypothetical protein
VATHWFSPFSLLPSVESRLLAAGLRRHHVVSDPLPQTTILVYDSPDRLFEGERISQSLPLSPHQMLIHYTKLISLSKHCRLISGWYVDQLSPRQLHEWVCGSLSQVSFDMVLTSHDIQIQRPSLEPFTALVVNFAIITEPDLLNLYLQLEYIAVAFGFPPDSNYFQRLSSAFEAPAVFEQWWFSRPVPDNLTILQLEQADEEIAALSLSVQQLTVTVKSLRLTIRNLLLLVNRLSQLLIRGVNHSSS